MKMTRRTYSIYQDEYEAAKEIIAKRGKTVSQAIREFLLSLRSSRLSPKQK